MIEVKNGQDPYSVIGQYIREHVSAIEDMIAVIEIDGKTSNELFMVDMNVDGYFIWKNDWYEGEENVVLTDFFPVSDACNPEDKGAPYVKGTWAYDESISYSSCPCSVCGSEALYKVDWYESGQGQSCNVEKYKSNFCPNCGADLRGE